MKSESKVHVVIKVTFGINITTTTIISTTITTTITAIKSPIAPMPQSVTAALETDT